MQMMSLGERSTFKFDSAAGYGAAGKGNVPPNANLLFDIELVGINSKAYKEKKKGRAR